MKRRSIRILKSCLAVLVALVCLEAEAVCEESPEQPAADRKVVAVTTSLLTPFFGAYYLEANVRASESFSVLVNTSYLTLENHDWKTRSGTAGAGVNYYFQGEALRRWYVEVVGELMFSSWRHEPSGQIAPIELGYNGYALVGYRFLCRRGPVLDLGAGVVAMHFPSARVTTAGGPVSSEPFSRVYPAGKVNLGWAF